MDDQNRGGSVAGQRAVPILRKFDRIGGVQDDRVDGSALQGVRQGRSRDRVQPHRPPQIGENGLFLEVPPIHVTHGPGMHRIPGDQHVRIFHQAAEDPERHPGVQKLLRRIRAQHRHVEVAAGQRELGLRSAAVAELEKGEPPHADGADPCAAGPGGVGDDLPGQVLAAGDHEPLPVRAPGRDGQEDGRRRQRRTEDEDERRGASIQRYRRPRRPSPSSPCSSFRWGTPGPPSPG